jgi:type I restriction enzyme S subunit
MTLVVPFEDIFKEETKLLAKHESWERVSLGEVCEVLNGFAFKSSLFSSSEGFPIIRIRDLARGRTETFYAGDYPSDYVVENGDVLVGMDGNFGCYEWSGGEALLNQRVCKLIPQENYLYRKFLLFGINGYLKAIQDATSSVTVGHLSSRDIQRIPFPLPPLNEQRRIVAKLEKLLGRADTAQARLTTIPRTLKRFRQSVLAAACSGRLTADWRGKNHVPEEYELATIEDIADYVGGFAYKSPTFIESSANQVIRIGNVRPFALKLEASPIFIPDDIAKATERFQLAPNDIVISMTGTKYKKDYGFAAMVTESEPKLFLNQRVSRLRCGDKVLPLFMLYWLQTDLFREFFFEGETGNVNQGNIGADGIRKAPIEFPLLAEQQEIVRRVEALFKTADALEARYRTAKAHIDKLTQSILAKAFRGELVPTEAELARQEGRDYESASALLERIKKERAMQPLTSKSSRPAKKKKDDATRKMFA